MPTTTLQDIVSGSTPKDVIKVDSSSSGYDSIETALSSESGPKQFVLAPGSYTPSSALTLESDQSIVGVGNPTISGQDVSMTGDNAVIEGITVSDATVTSSGAGNRIHRCVVTGSKSSDVTATTVQIDGDSTHVVDLDLTNRRIETTGLANRILRCEVRGFITDEYSSPSNYDELQIDGDNTFADENLVEGSIGGAGSNQKGTNHTVTSA